MNDPYGGPESRPLRNPYGGVGGDPNDIDNKPVMSAPTPALHVGGDPNAPLLRDANGNVVYGQSGTPVGAPAGAGGAGATPAATTTPAAAGTTAATTTGLAATATKAIPWLELLYGIIKSQQHGSFQTPPTSPWQERIFGKYYDWMQGGSPTNAALSPAIMEMMKSTNPEFTLPNLIGPQAGQNVLPNGGHVGGANVDWDALLKRLTTGGAPPAVAPTP